MRSRWLIGAVAVALLIQVSPSARAGLIGNGTNTVSATSFLGAVSAPLPPYPNTIDYVNSMGMTMDTPPPTIPVTFVEDALSLTTIAVGDTQITITNNAPSGTAFCPGAPPCNNTFAGFGFTFTGVDITGVSVDPASAADFLPNTTSPHMGLQLLSSTDILVDVTGDAPNMGDKLILDVMTTGTTPTPIPEPASLAFLASGLVGLLAIKQRAKRVPMLPVRFCD
jgi:hypothetical protein